VGCVRLRQQQQQQQFQQLQQQRQQMKLNWQVIVANKKDLTFFWVSPLTANRFHFKGKAQFQFWLRETQKL